MKKAAGDIIIFRKCTINYNHMIYGACDMKSDRENFFVIFGYFLDLYTSNNPKSQKFEKIKKPPGDIIILHKFTKNPGHML